MKIIDKLRNAGYKTQRNLTEFEISGALLARYTKLPEAYLMFLRSFETITNVSETTWFISNNDFDDKTNNEFKWNAFELMSLEWSEDDAEELSVVKAFWENHIPILMSVKEGYQFWAICLSDHQFGEIVHGQEPVFEEVTNVCNSFNEFIDLIVSGDLKIVSE